VTRTLLIAGLIVLAAFLPLVLAPPAFALDAPAGVTRHAATRTVQPSPAPALASFLSRAPPLR